MPAPSINPITPDQSNYTISNSTGLLADFFLVDLANGAEFTVQCPTTAVVKLFQGATSINLSPTSNINDSVTFPGRTVTTTVNVAGPTGTIDVQIQASGPATEYWEIQALTSVASTYVVTAGASATIRRVLADPNVQTGSLGIKEHVVGVPLSGQATYVVVVSPAPPPGLPALPTLTADWTYTGGVSLPSFTHAAAQAVGLSVTANASFNSPGVYASTPLSFKLLANYSTGVAVFGDWVVTITPRNHYLILLLDRSGSMSSAITGSTQAKWELAVIAAHAWADLFVAFRKGVANADRAGIMTFQSSSCSWTSTIIGSPDIKIEIPSGGAPESVSAFESDINVGVLSLSPPGGCTPIGDGLMDAMTAFKTLPNIGSDDRFVIFLVTDGMENSGATVVNPATPLTMGAQYFNSSSRRNQSDLAIVNGSMSIYTLGIGKPGQVDEDVLNSLPHTSNADGLYYLVDTAQEVLTAFGNFLGDSLGAQPLAYNAASGTFPLDPNENRLAVVVRVVPGQEIRLAWQQGGAFVTIAGKGITAPAGVTYHHRNGHCIATVDFSLAGGLTGSYDNSQQSTWRIQLLSPDGTPAVSDVLALVDLFAAFDITFDRPEYRTGQPMLITCRIRAGKEPVVGATVKVRLRRPGEGLGTFLSVNGAQYKPRPFFVSRRGAAAVGTAEVFAPKSVMLQTLLAEKNLAQLPVISVTTGIFTDGTSLLIDDGAHGDGAAGDGNYANTFADTTKEGTYTFAFDISATLPDGSTFKRTFTQSKWVGVEVVPWNSLVAIAAATTLPNQQVSRQILVTPRDARGEFLGPFRTNEIAFRATVGSFQGDLVDLPDGRYSQTLVYPQGQNPVVTVTVQGKPLEPVPVEPGAGCLVAPVLWLIRLFKWLIAKLKKLIGMP